MVIFRQDSPVTLRFVLLTQVRLPSEKLCHFFEKFDLKFCRPPKLPAGRKIPGTHRDLFGTSPSGRKYMFPRARVRGVLVSTPRTAVSGDGIVPRVTSETARVRGVCASKVRGVLKSTRAREYVFSVKA